MHRYVVEVTTASHAALRAGVTAEPRCPGAPAFHRIVVAALTDDEAVLTAAQMATATSGEMCTSTVLVEFPT
ncbi:hypothetical protein [Pseudonocardia parietis]|uniref:Uncharacterized protein n=1 Tax=Pseudonocardia parietis TaxID=570936 RepID=A0ABS4W253_9PSEU|nr:hypothetical protein [Pseudonocardia parietis]MBP2370188.1 hypothetical protein [Pseudonocardia parietis]